MIHSSRSLFRSFSSLALSSSLLLLSGALWSLRAEAQIDVWIDPGHGGTDPGNIGVGGTQEKVVTRQTAGQIANVLLIGGYLALLTHSGDTYPTLDQRAAIARSGLATVDVFDAAGRRAYSRSLPVVDGRVDYYWSGVSETGAVMPAGKYVVRFRLGSATANTGVVLVR